MHCDTPPPQSSGVPVPRSQAGQASPAPNLLKDVPPWAIELMKEQRTVRIELASLAAALMRRGLLTEQELNQARVDVAAQANREFVAMASHMGRQAAQRPTEPGKPADPRRAPG